MLRLQKNPPLYLGGTSWSEGPGRMGELAAELRYTFAQNRDLGHKTRITPHISTANSHTMRKRSIFKAEYQLSKK